MAQINNGLLNFIILNQNYKKFFSFCDKNRLTFPNKQHSAEIRGQVVGKFSAETAGRKARTLIFLLNYSHQAGLKMDIREIKMVHTSCGMWPARI